MRNRLPSGVIAAGRFAHNQVYSNAIRATRSAAQEVLMHTANRPHGRSNALRLAAALALLMACQDAGTAAELPSGTAPAPTALAAPPKAQPAPPSAAAPGMTGAAIGGAPA